MDQPDVWQIQMGQGQRIVILGAAPPPQTQQNAHGSQALRIQMIRLDAQQRHSEKIALNVSDSVATKIPVKWFQKPTSGLLYAQLTEIANILNAKAWRAFWLQKHRVAKMMNAQPKVQTA